jgi:hypothetical protein
MTQQQSIMKGDAHQKLGSAGFIIGAILFVIGSLLSLGFISDESNMQELLKKLGEGAVFAQGAELVWAFSFLALMIGVAGVYRSVTASGAA